jgi:hypothetical protein
MPRSINMNFNLNKKMVLTRTPVITTTSNIERRVSYTSIIINCNKFNMKSIFSSRGTSCS